MTKLTTEITIEELQYRINAHENDLTQMWTADYLLNVQKELLALKQAAKNPVAWVVGDEEIADFKNGREVCVMRDCDDEHLDYLPLYAAPVLPKQPETQFDEIALDTAREIMRDVNQRHELIGGECQLLARIQCRINDVLCNVAAPAQPVIPEQPEFYTKPDRFLPECLKPEEISGERRNSRIAELMGWFDRYYSGKANPKWLKPHVAELCYYILTVPQLSAQPVSQPSNSPVIPDAYVLDELGRMMLNGVCEPRVSFGAGWNACRSEMLKAQPVSEPYKFLDERAKYRVIIEGFSNSRSVDFEACSQEEAEEIGRDIFHEECNYGVERLESIPAQESE